MALVKPDTSRLAKIKVIAVGGGGGNSIQHMIEDTQIEGVEFIAINTDAQVLLNNPAETKVQIGEKLTRGLGSGGNPEMGKQAADESKEKIKELLLDTDMVFLTAGMGGGCLRGSSLIYTNPKGPVRIDSINPGSNVYSLENGKLARKKVLAAMKTGIKKVFEIKTRNQALVASYDHPFLKVNPINPDKQNRFHDFKFEWTEARSLAPGDLVVNLRSVPVLAENSGSLQEIIKNPQFCRLFGFLLGDGWVSRSKDSWKIHFSPSIYPDRNEKYINLVKDLLGLQMKKSTSSWYYANSKHVYNLLSSLGLNKRAKEKEVPEWIFKLSDAHKKQFILGLVDADGHYLHQLKPNGQKRTEIRLEMGSEKLIKQLKVLCTLLGLRTSNVSSRTRKIKAPNSPKPVELTSWNLRIYKLYELDPDLKEDTRKRIGKGFLHGYRGPTKDPFFDHFGFTAVRSVKEMEEEEVYNITVDGSHNFVSEGFIVHNTGTGASPIVAQAAKEAGALTVAIVTKPFAFEGTRRMVAAEEGIESLRPNVDALIVIPNQRLMDVIDRKTTLADAFKVVDSVLSHGVQGISEIITTPGLINVDFADVRAIMKDAGSALLGIGTGVGDNRAQMAARAAISSPLLEVSIEGAKGVLFNIAGGQDITMAEVDEAARIISESADADANIIFGATINERLSDQMRITVVATGFDEMRSRLGRMVSPPKPQTVAQSPQGILSVAPQEPQITTFPGSIFRPRPPVTPNPVQQTQPQSTPIQNDSDDDRKKDEWGEKFEIPAFLRQNRN
ncbi:MAG: hypothetical protein AAB599_01580 [Patescibacteria group bacterium]